VSRSSHANCTVIAFTAVFELSYARYFTAANSQLGSLFRARLPRPEEI